MILIDTGPLVALFDRRDEQHERCVATASSITDALVTTDAVLTEVFHMLRPGTDNCAAFQSFVAEPAMKRWAVDDEGLRRSIDLMVEYADHQMDFADATLVAAAESLRIDTIFTLDRRDFTAYRPRIGRTLSRFRILQGTSEQIHMSS